MITKETFTTWIVLTVFFSFWVSHFVFMPTSIEKRAKDLNLMQYDSKVDGFVLKDSVCIDEWDFYYLQHGNMDKPENE